MTRIELRDRPTYGSLLGSFFQGEFDRAAHPVHGTISWAKDASMTHYVLGSVQSSCDMLASRLAGVWGAADHELAEEVSRLYQTFSEDTKPLPSDFAAIWDSNLGRLYES